MYNKIKDKTIDINGTKTVRFILEKLKNQEIVIPKFQRDYVWDIKKIVDFLNSILNIEPFGTIILWTPKDDFEWLEERNKFVEIVSKQSKKNIKIRQYLIDGQQRLTSLLILFNAKQIESFFNNDEDTDTKALKLPDGWNFGSQIYFQYLDDTINDFQMKFVSKKMKNTIPLLELLNKNLDVLKFNQKIKKNNKNLEDEIISAITNEIVNIKSNLEDTLISTITLENHILDDVIKIFSNINTKGVKLSYFNLVHARWSNLVDQNGVKFNFEKKVQNLLLSFNYGYNEMNQEDFVDSLYLHLNDSEPLISSGKKIDFELKIDNTKQWLDKFKLNEIAFRKSFEFLKGTLNMNHKYLPSKNIFKWLTYFYIKMDKRNINGAQVKIIKEYIKLASINDRYRSGTNEKLKEDLDFVNNVLMSENINKEWEKWKDSDNNPFQKKELTIDILRRTSSSSTSMISKFIKFLLHSDTKSFYEAKTHINVDDIDMHHIFPDKSEIVKIKISNGEWQKNEINNIANITPLLSKDNKRISNKNPKDYLEEILQDGVSEIIEIMRKHGINTIHLSKNDFKKFFDERSKWLINEVNKF
ncbi:MAG: GmrSD restriction endonuclease domain-containing protein [Metamycoplasmataceae bacterium]